MVSAPSLGLVARGAAAAVASVAVGIAPPAAGQTGTDPPAGSEPAFTLADGRITESSGLAASAIHPGVVYTINDSGHGAQVFALNETGQVAATLTLREVAPYDWEALSPGPENRIWIGDIGDNDRIRSEISVYRFIEPAVVGDANVTYNQYELTYPDGAHDAEAMLVHPQTGRLYIVTKNLTGGGAIYEAPAELSADVTNPLTKIADAPAAITAGAFLPDGSAIVLRSYSHGYVLSWPEAETDRLLAMPEQPMSESLAVHPDGDRLLTGAEGEETTVWSVPLDGPPPPYAEDEAGGGEQKKGGGEGAGKSPASKQVADPAEPGAGDESSDGNSSPLFLISWLEGVSPWVLLGVALVAAVAGIIAFPTGRRPSSRAD